MRCMGGSRRITKGDMDDDFNKCIYYVAGGKFHTHWHNTNYSQEA